VINSPEVHLGIKRQNSKVGRKNITIVSYKNHLDRFCITKKQFLVKYLQHNLVQFLVQELGKTKHTTYPKISYRGLVDLDIQQI
jgi:hypothetical protein